VWQLRFLSAKRNPRRNKIGDTGPLPLPLGIVYASSLQPRKIYGHYVKRGNARTESGFVSAALESRADVNVSDGITMCAAHWVSRRRKIEKGRKSRRRVKISVPVYVYVFASCLLSRASSDSSRSVFDSERNQSFDNSRLDSWNFLGIDFQRVLSNWKLVTGGSRLDQSNLQWWYYIQRYEQRFLWFLNLRQHELPSGCIVQISGNVRRWSGSERPQATAGARPRLG